MRTTSTRFLRATCSHAPRRARLVYDAHELYSGFEQHPPRIWHGSRSSLEGRLARARRRGRDGQRADRGRADAAAAAPAAAAPRPQLPAARARRRRAAARRSGAGGLSGGGRPRPAARRRRRGGACRARGRVSRPSLGGDGRPSQGSGRAARRARRARRGASAPFDIGLVIDRPETDNTRARPPEQAVRVPHGGSRGRGPACARDGGARGGVRSRRRLRAGLSRRCAAAACGGSSGARRDAPPGARAWPSLASTPSSSVPHSVRAWGI